MHKVQGISHELGVKAARQAMGGSGISRTWQRLGCVFSVVVLTACSSLQSSKQQEPSPPTAERREVRLGLALGGGAARGFAHVGVIQV